MGCEENGLAEQFGVDANHHPSREMMLQFSCLS